MDGENNDADMAEEEQVIDEDVHDLDQEDMEEDEDLDQRIASLRATLEAAPNNYDSQLELIHLLRKNGDLEVLRSERKIISEKFTMDPDFWMLWIQDEIECESEKDEIKKLFEQACRDFHSPKIYLEYAQWACGVSIPSAEQVMEEAINKIGLRPDCAFLIWNSYIDLEKMILASISGEAGVEQKAKISRIYGRLLRIPHVDMETSWNDYCAFMGNEFEKKVELEYKGALKLMSELEEFENDLKKDTLSPDERLAILCDCVEFEKRGGDPSRVQMAYERALVESASAPNSNLWLEYGAWLDFELKDASTAVNVYTRAVRHSPCAALWQQFLTALERANMWESIDEKWDEAINSALNAEEGLSLYRTYIYSLRRRAVKETASAGPVDYSRVLAAFDDGTVLLQDRFGAHWDSPKAQFRKNHAHFLYTDGKQPEKARKIWSDVLASGCGHMASAWIEAANMERFFGTVNNARKLLYRAINSASDHPHAAFDALIQFEREQGTLEELDRALMKVNAQATRIAARPQKKKEKEGVKKEIKGIKKKTGEKEADFEESETGRAVKAGKVIAAGKRRISAEFASTDGSVFSTVKLAKVVDKDGFAVPLLPKISSLKELNEVPKLPDEDTSKEGSSGGITTIFISNLDFKLPKEKILEIFPEAKEVRLVYRGMSKLHKGFGYADFMNATDANKALQKDRTLINGRPMYVSEYKPHDKGVRNEFRYATSLEKSKIFVGNVHYDATSEQLKAAFTEFGTVKDVRIVTHKSGKSKGCAYVEFENEDSAKAATQAEDIVLLDRKLSVALSNPPKKQDQNEVKESGLLRQRNKIDLVPRTISQTKPFSSVSGKAAMQVSLEEPEVSMVDSSKSKPVEGKMSNEQFRKFL